MTMQTKKYKVTYRGFTEAKGSITEDDFYYTDAYSEASAVSIVDGVNENRDTPLYDVKVISVIIEDYPNEECTW